MLAKAVEVLSAHAAEVTAGLVGCVVFAVVVIAVNLVSRRPKHYKINAAAIRRS